MSISPVDVLEDILKPVHTMIYNKRLGFEVLIEGTPGLVVTTDKIRVQQILLNLANNALKFVSNGFIRLMACKSGNNLRLSVEDFWSGYSCFQSHQSFSKVLTIFGCHFSGNRIGALPL